MTVNKSESKKKKKNMFCIIMFFRNSCGSLKLQYLRRLVDLIGGHACV